MASFFGFVMAVALTIMACTASPSLSLSSHQLKLETITAAPALLPNTPQSPSTELSPDISPLLPSPGGVVPSSGYFIPTIPSNPSHNPDEMAAFGPNSAVSPSAQLQESSAVSLNLVKSQNIAVFMSFLASWSVLIFAV